METLLVSKADYLFGINDDRIPPSSILYRLLESRCCGESENSSPDIDALEDADALEAADGSIFGEYVTDEDYDKSMIEDYEVERNKKSFEDDSCDHWVEMSYEKFFELALKNIAD